jgi:hypothetical protein
MARASGPASLANRRRAGALVGEHGSLRAIAGVRSSRRSPASFVRRRSAASSTVNRTGNVVRRDSCGLSRPRSARVSPSPLINLALMTRPPAAGPRSRTCDRPCLFMRTSPEQFREHRTDSELRWLVPADGSGPEGRRVIARRGRMRMPLSSEPQSIRTRSEESEEGDAPPNVKVVACSKSQRRTKTMKTG